MTPPASSTGPRPLVALALCVGSGAVWIGSLLFGPLWPLAAVCHAPLLFVYARRGRVSLVYALAGIFGAMVLGQYVTIVFGLLTPVVFAPLHAMFFWPALPLYLRWIYGRWNPPLALAFPPILVACEFAWVNWQYQRLGVYPIGYALADHPTLIQAADLGGVYLLSFVLASISGAAADIALWLENRSDDQRGKRAKRSLVLAGLLAGAIPVYGALRIDRTPASAGPRVALVQPALKHRTLAVYGVHLTQMLMTLESVPPGSVDLIVWPENAILDFLDRKGKYLDDIAWLSRTEGAPVLLGAEGHAPADLHRSTNSAFLVDGDGRTLGRYDKIDLIPWTEYFPFEGLLSKWAPDLNLRHFEFVTGLLGYFPTGMAGLRTTRFDLPSPRGPVPFAVSLCSENLTPARSRGGAELGARILFNLISEGEVGGLIQQHLFRVCQVRAAEIHRPFVRVGNTGISGVIDANGRADTLLRGSTTGATTGEPGVLIASIPILSERRTLYARTGDLFAWTMLIASLLLAAAARFGPRANRTAPRQRGATSSLATLVPAILMAIAALSCGRGAGAPAVDDRGLQRAGREAFDRRDYRTALDAFMSIARSDPGNQQACSHIAEIFRLGNLDRQGYQFFDALVRRGLRTPELLSYDAFFQERLWRKNQALALYREALASDPASRNAVLRAVSLLLEEGETESAMRIAAAAVATRPDPEFLLLLARARLEDGALPEAQESLTLARQASADPVRCDLIEGSLRIAQGREGEADAMFREALKKDPGSEDALYNLVRLALRRGDLEDARRRLASLRTIEERKWS